MQYQILFLLTSWTWLPMLAQPTNEVGNVGAEEVGLPFIQNYSPDEYDADHQNFCGLQASNGLIYVGNADGLLEYDGETWELYTLQNASVIFSLAQDDHGNIYYGSVADFGWLSTDSSGSYHLQSLLGQMNDSSRLSVGEIWGIDVVSDQIYFRSASHLFRLHDDEVIQLPITGLLGCSFVSEGSYFVHDPGQGIAKVDGIDAHWIISASELDSIFFRSIVTGDDGTWIGLTANDGLYAIRDRKPAPFANDLNQFWRSTRALDMVRLANGWISVSTGKGLIIMDQSGRVIQQMSTDQGLVGNFCIASFQDKQNAVWVATSGGISRVEVASPFSIFDGRNGMQGYVDMIHRHDGRLYMAGQTGFGFLTRSAAHFNLPVFEPIAGSTLHALYLMSRGRELFGASRAGIFTIEDDRLNIINNYQAGALLQSNYDTNLIYVGYRGALGLLRPTSQGWDLMDVIEEVDDDIRQMIEDDEGRLWIEPQDGGIWLVTFTHLREDSLSDYTYKYFKTGRDLPVGSIFLHKYRGAAMFEVNGQIYRYNPGLDSIVPYPEFGMRFDFDGYIAPKLTGDLHSLWIKAQVDQKERSELFFAREVSEDSTLVEFTDMRRITLSVSKALFPDHNGVLWHGGRSGIVRHDLKVPVNLDPSPKLLIRKVIIDGDSILYSGAGLTERIPDVEFGHDYRFHFAFPSFDHEKDNLYQYYLRGFDHTWSEWTLEAHKDYTRLPHGDYEFQVRGKNIYDQISATGIFAFTILPPWYHSWWAYLCYSILVVLGIMTLVRWRSNQLRKEKLALQQIVNARTSELQVRNEQLEAQKGQLSLQASELKQVDQLKSRLLANISHEFRTPLTLIKGPLDQLQRFPETVLSAKHATMMQRNTNRLLRLVNQLLDLSKLDAGAMPLNVTEGNLFRCLRAAASAFSSHAAQRNLDYQIKIPSDHIWSSFDRDKMEEVVYNLLSNAFKFTPDHGTILFAADHRSGRLNIEVSDSGQGIPTQDQAQIFDRFFQVDNSSTKSSEGSGIGLSLVKEFIDLMQGDITLESELGKGTSFFISIPMSIIEQPDHRGVLLNSIKTNFPVAEMSPLAKDDGTLSVLIVEDNVDMRAYIGDQLSTNYIIWEADTGQQGLVSAREKIPDLIITDVMMPEMDGMQLCSILKSDPATSHIPVIMLTARAGLEEKIEGLETGADAYLTKPFSVPELEAVVKNLIEQRRRLQSIFSSKIDQFSPQEIDWPTLDQEFIQQVLDLLEERHGDADFGVPTMQQSLAMSKTQLHRKMKALTNQAPGEFLRNFRLKRAAQILKRGENVTQTAYAVGFNNLSYFAKCFKDLHGVSPKEYA